MNEGPGRPARDARGGTALAGHLSLSALLAFVVTVVWAAGGGLDSYFWPMWAWLGLGIPVALHFAIRRGRSLPRGRERQLALQAGVSIVVVTALVLIWAMSGGGVFWPVFPVLALALVYGVHAAVRPPRRLAARVDELTRTRRGALDVQAAELRRIERDLHDGAQSRLVALSLQLGRAEERLSHQPEVEALVRRAREEAAAAIAELRDLARGIAPPVLADRGLAAAVQALADRSSAAVTVEASLEERPPPVVETAAYFVAAEALTNAAKHAGGAAVRIELTRSRDWLTVEVVDDGPGGADGGGSGLTGLRQRIEALDGTLEVLSPAGHGTRVRALLPCV
jgi:signal transduction histidine kinase